MIEMDVFEGTNRRAIEESHLTHVRLKYNPDGSEDKVKARLIAGGDRQDKTVLQQ
jgi:hypothetical protein